MNQLVERNVRLFVYGDPCERQSPALRAINTAAEARLIKRLLSSNVDADAEPLRHTFEMDRQEFDEGLFCWKGLLYYKWTLIEAAPRALAVAKAVARCRPSSRAAPEVMRRLASARRSVAQAIMLTRETARASLNGHDVAFASLVNGEPRAFRAFLRSAPSLFVALGQQLGGVNHVVSFWSYRFPEGSALDATAEELLDILLDFEQALVLAAPVPLFA
jgi:hypothetical protein